MKRRNLILTTLLAGSLASVSFAGISQASPFCNDRHGAHAERMGYGNKHDRDPMKYLMRNVDLTEAQQTEIKTIIETNQKGSEEVRKQLRDSHQALHDLATSADYSLDRARALADQQAKLEADQIVARIDTMHRVHQVLTPEQQTKMKAAREQRMEKRKAWMDGQKDN